MTLPEVFKKAIAKIPFHIDPDGKNILRIKENDVSCDGCQWVEISLNDPSSAFCFSIDIKDKEGFDFVFPFFSIDEKTNISGLRSKNDAIVIYHSERKNYVFLIELKSKNSGNYLQQLTLSKLFVTFIIDRLNVINKAYDFKTENIDFRGILFRYRTQNNKGTTRIKGQAVYENKNGLLITEVSCRTQYRIQYFTS
jgi:hypothetical protein